MGFMYPFLKFGIIGLSISFRRLQILAGTFNRLHELDKRCVIGCRCSMKIEPVTRRTKLTFDTLGQKRIVVSTLATIGEVNFALDYPARILKQV